VARWLFCFGLGVYLLGCHNLQNSFLNLNNLLRMAISHEPSAIIYLQHSLFGLLKTITKTGITTKPAIIHQGAVSISVSALNSLKPTAVVLNEKSPTGIDCGPDASPVQLAGFTIEANASLGELNDLLPV
jgi:hypothetical protein